MRSPLALVPRSLVAVTLFACSDTGGPTTADTAATADSDASSDIATPDTVAPDSSAPADTAPVETDGTASDVAADANDADTNDAGPTISSVIGVSGGVYIYSDVLWAEFHDGMEIVRASQAPACFVRVLGATTGPSWAGPLTIAGSMIGSEGPIVVDRASFTVFGQYNHVASFFDPSVEHSVEVSLAGETPFPSLPPTTFVTPDVGGVAVTRPVIEEGRELAVSIAEDLEVQWTVPAGDIVDERLMFRLGNLFNQPSGLVVDVTCVFPLAAGRGVVPAVLLAELHRRAGPDARGGIFSQVETGLEVRLEGATYFLRASVPQDSPGFEAAPVRLEDPSTIP